MEIAEIVIDLARAFKAIDETAPIGSNLRSGKTFSPGIGPLPENKTVRLAVEWLVSHETARYKMARMKRTPDVLIPGKWALEFKMLRPFGDDGRPAEHWSQNVLHPYPGNISSIGDAIKMVHSLLPERRGIVVFGYEHLPAKISLDTAIEAFQVITTQVIGLRLGPRAVASFSPLVHPHHQAGRIFGWEILGRPRQDPKQRDDSPRFS